MIRETGNLRGSGCCKVVFALLAAHGVSHAAISAQPNNATEQNKAANVAPGKLTDKPIELKNDDGQAAGKKSFPRGIASAFQSPDGKYFLTSIRIHGGRYGHPRAPKEDFFVSLCDRDFNPIADFSFPYSKFKRGKPKWVKLPLKPTELPDDFVICLNFNAQRTKGVYVSHDAEGKSLVGLPNKPAGTFSGGDWLIRPQVDTLKQP